MSDLFDAGRRPTILRTASAAAALVGLALALVVPVVGQNLVFGIFLLPTAAVLVAVRFLMPGEEPAKHYLVIAASLLLTILPSVGFVLAAIGTGG